MLEDGTDACVVVGFVVRRRWLRLRLRLVGLVDGCLHLCPL